MFKLDQIKRTRAKQLRVLEKFGQVETDITEQTLKLTRFEEVYFEFEKKQFQGLLETTS